uniref:Uncharacterized protein n=1 Tax=Anguilla anguilla TaxID=7936 RepID=A0A0E9R6C2_ANGAN
MKECVNAVGE